MRSRWLNQLLKARQQIEHFHGKIQNKLGKVALTAFKNKQKKKNSKWNNLLGEFNKQFFEYVEAAVKFFLWLFSPQIISSFLIQGSCVVSLVACFSDCPQMRSVLTGSSLDCAIQNWDKFFREGLKGALSSERGLMPLLIWKYFLKSIWLQ